MTVPLDIPRPAELGARWSAAAAVLAARGPRWAESAHANKPDTWHYDDGGGNWIDLRLLDGDRAVLIGHDHEYSETYYGAGADYFGEQRTDLFAHTPTWWAAGVADYLELAESLTIWIGFVYGFDGEGWSRTEYTSPDGFESMALPAMSDGATTDFMATQVDGYAQDRSLGTHADRAAVADALGECPSLTLGTATTLLFGRRDDAAIAASAAHAFLPR